MNVLQAMKHFATSADWRFRYLTKLGVYNNMGDAEFLKRKFTLALGYPLDLDDPKTFNEKLQWLKLYNRKSEYTMMVDKYAVRQYIAETIGEEYLVPLIGVWRDPDEIDFNALPDQFVLKCNHNSGLGMCICRDKSKLDIPRVKKGLRKGLRQNYYLSYREWPYKDVPRRIIAEEYLTDGSDGGPMDYKMDYKILCFHGEPKLIEFYYDGDWRLQSIQQPGEINSAAPAPKPETLDEMLRLSAVLSEGMPHVRVDWYEVRGRLYFGELTFFDGAGFEPFEEKAQDILLGSWIHLDEVK